ncbi:MAG: T9SS type A sorting domain-containing protein [Chlorobi bacterium]|nr:T9SS type A sorting domain-containing protein [Chlorobiota bacterium]
MKKSILILFLLSIYINIQAQHFFKDEKDKCGFDIENEKQMYDLLGDNWGYSYDSLLNDIAIWGQNDFIQTQSIGQTTLGREMYELTITNFAVTKTLKHRIYIHARTHPGEVQAFWVTREIINYLSGDSEIGSFLRENCIFHIIPMYNPDGVELEYPRENANGVDIESNWNADVPEIEVFNLKNRFFDLMQEENPIEIALNMHSAVACKRYFVYHHENGTSTSYTGLEQNFISSVRSQFLSGIQPYDYYVSWSGGTPSQYPESWWWTNYQEEVLALTYEDMNCESAGLFDQTAYAILYGISDYLNLGFVSVNDIANEKHNSVVAFPNPFNNEISIKNNTDENYKNVFITDITGRKVFEFSNNLQGNATLIWNGLNGNGKELPGGIYIFNAVNNQKVTVLKILKQY